MKSIIARILPPLALILGLAGCYLHQWPVTAHVVDRSTFRLTETNAHGSYRGTAWAVQPNLLVTAGHMCEGGGEFTVTTYGGYTIPAKIVAFRHGETPDLNGQTGEDLCLLKADVDATPLVVAYAMPKVGAKIGYAGYPAGVHAIGEGVYLGNNEGSAPMHPGASGSAVFTSVGVFGVLIQSRYARPLHESCEPDLWGGEECALDRLDDVTGEVVVPVDKLRAFLKEAGVSPTDPPPHVPEPDEVFPQPGLG